MYVPLLVLISVPASLLLHVVSGMAEREGNEQLDAAVLPSKGWNSLCICQSAGHDSSESGPFLLHFLEYLLKRSMYIL
jgi:hypothetical protein